MSIYCNILQLINCRRFLLHRDWKQAGVATAAAAAVADDDDDDDDDDD